MTNEIVSEANRLKQEAGKDLSEQLALKFGELKSEGIIKRFKKSVNFPHSNYQYQKQYLANFLIETLDDQYIVINSSTSFRNDRFKIQAYDLEGIKQHSAIAEKIIASIMLYPDDQANNKTFNTFKGLLENKKAYTPATHTLLLSEFIEFLENHKTATEEEKIKEQEETELQKNQVAENIVNYNPVELGSYYGLKGNAFEKEIVEKLNDTQLLENYKLFNSTTDEIFNLVIQALVADFSISPNEIIHLKASNTITKLKNGGNAKTDLAVKLTTQKGTFEATVSIKNTTQSRVSCHDYKATDFIRVLDPQNLRLAYYLNLFQKSGSDKDFIKNLKGNDSVKEFEEILTPYKQKLMEWALTGAHDSENLIEPKLQISQYLLINKNGTIKMVKFESYIAELNTNIPNLKYGLPLSWTYPSKNRGKRIQLKLPILI